MAVAADARPRIDRRLGIVWGVDRGIARRRTTRPRAARDGKGGDDDDEPHTSIIYFG
jgi:hypothetical protein